MNIRSVLLTAMTFGGALVACGGKAIVEGQPSAIKAADADAGAGLILPTCSPPPEARTPPPDVVQGADTCATDADCTAGANGHCIYDYDFPLNDTNPQGEHLKCQYDECSADSECGPNRICMCIVGQMQCMSGNCRTNADCPKGSICDHVRPFCNGGAGGPGLADGTIGLFCHAPTDECSEDADCKSTEPSPLRAGACTFDDASLHWKCAYCGPSN
jgi:hypothetical protein